MLLSMLGVCVRRTPSDTPWKESEWQLTKCQLWVRYVALTYTGSDCLMWPFDKANVGESYGRLLARGARWGAHRFVCFVAHGVPPSDKTLACHSCGHGYDGCVAPEHLYWGSKKDNSEDVYRHGWVRKLTLEQVREIRTSSLSNKELAAKFGVDRTVPWQVRTGKSYGFLQ